LTRLLGRARAVELAPIRVNAVVSGVVRAEMWDGIPHADRDIAHGSTAKATLTGVSRSEEVMAHSRAPIADGSGLSPDGLDGRVALVTGGSGGIGRALVLRLAAEGAAVAVGYGANAEAAHNTAADVISAGGRAVAVGSDLRRSESAAELVDAVQEALGPIDVLVGNAGLGVARPFEEVSSEDFDEMIAVNLRAPFLLAQRTLPGMRERRFGRVLFMSSIAAFTGGIVGPHYAASKAGLHGLTHFLAARFAPFGVTVNALAPALIAETGMLPGDPQQLRKQIPVGRLGRPAEVADLALSILRNPYLANQVISIDGGMYPR
jgi:3-oxoacyl-[acyl-carrier protein] reductase